MPSLRSTGFFRFWAGETVSMGGTQLTLFALPLVAVLALDATAWQMGVITAAGAAAPLLFSLPTGAFADRYDRIFAMHLANMGRLAVLLSVPLLYWFDLLNVWILALVMLLTEGLSLLFDNARSAYIPTLVPKKMLSRANSWTQGSVAVGDVAGPGAGGLLVQALGAPFVLVIDAATYLFSSLMLRGMPRGPQKSTSDGDSVSWKYIRTGITLLRRDRIQFPVTLSAAHSNLFHTMFFTVFVLYAIRVLGFSPVALGMVTVVSGVFGLLAVSTAPALITRLGCGKLLILTFLVPGPASLLVPLANDSSAWASYLMVGAGLSLWSYAVVVNLVTCETVKQALVPGEYLGRVTATIRLISWGVEPLGALLAGALSMTLLGLNGTLFLASLGLSTSVIWMLASAEARRLRDVGEPAEEEHSPSS